MEIISTEFSVVLKRSWWSLGDEQTALPMSGLYYDHFQSKKLSRVIFECLFIFEEEKSF